MSRRAPRHQGPRPVALFIWTNGEQLVEDQAPDDDRRNPCPHCHALAWEPCTRPSRRVGTGRGGRVPMRGVHDSRRNPQETQP